MAVNSVPASTSLLEEFNWLAPGRDKTSDGTVGDSAHKQSASDHNPDETGNTGGAEDSDSIDEVHARDVDASGPWPSGWSMERCVQIILSYARAGKLPGLQNVIYNRRIWSRSWGWSEDSYSGSNPHDKHSHFSFRYGSGSGSSNPENFTGPWGIKVTREAEIEEAEEMNVNEFKVALREELVNGAVSRERIEQASVSYAGGPLPDGISLGHVFSELLENSRAAKERLEAIETRLATLESSTTP